MRQISVNSQGVGFSAQAGQEVPRNCYRDIGVEGDPLQFPLSHQPPDAQILEAAGKGPQQPQQIDPPLQALPRAEAGGQAIGMGGFGVTGRPHGE